MIEQEEIQQAITTDEYAGQGVLMFMILKPASARLSMKKGSGS